MRKFWYNQILSDRSNRFFVFRCPYINSKYNSSHKRKVLGSKLGRANDCRLPSDNLALFGCVIFQEG